MFYTKISKTIVAKLFWIKITFFVKWAKHWSKPVYPAVFKTNRIDQKNRQIAKHE